MKYPPCGGVRGARFSMQELQRANDALDALTPASVLDGSLAGQTVVVAGNSPSLNTAPWKKLAGHPVVGCNRGLRKKGVRYTHLVIADREPYCQERDNGNLERFVRAGGILLGSDSLFDPTVLLRGPLQNANRLAQPTPDFEVHVYKIGTLGQKNAQAKRVNAEIKRKTSVGWVLNCDTFKKPLESCLNISGSMLQTAAILGAKRLIFVGLELKWKDEQHSHFFGSGRGVGAYPQNESTVDYILACLREAKKQFKQRGITWVNLSPVKDSPFASVFGNGWL